MLILITWKDYASSVAFPVRNNPNTGSEPRVVRYAELPEFLEDFGEEYDPVFHIFSRGGVDFRPRMSFTAADNSR